MLNRQVTKATKFLYDFMAWEKEVQQSRPDVYRWVTATEWMLEKAYPLSRRSFQACNKTYIRDNGRHERIQSCAHKWAIAAECSVTESCGDS